MNTAPLAEQNVFEAMRTGRDIPEPEVTKNRSGVTSERRQAKLIPQSDIGATSYWNTHLKMGSEVVSFRHVPVTGYVWNWALVCAADLSSASGKD